MRCGRCATPPPLAGGITELAWIGAHVLMYPLGTRTEALRPDPRNRPGEQSPGVRALFAADPLAARIPVLLVHGLVDNRSVFTVMRRSLQRRGFASVCSWNYSPLLTDVARGARDLGEHIERICEQTGHDRVHVVGHSLGGLMARYYVQRQGGDRRVESLVTLGTPHLGSVWAHVAAHAAGAPASTRVAGVRRSSRSPRPGAAHGSPRSTATSTRWCCPPTRAGATTPTSRARNVLVRGVGHMTLPTHRGVLDEVAATLAGRVGSRASPRGRRRLIDGPVRSPAPSGRPSSGHRLCQ